MPSEPTIRVSDAEREAVVATLGEHHAAGRLTLSELQERMEEALRSVTRGDLQRTVADLPTPVPATQRGTAGNGACSGPRQGLGPWLVTGVVCLLVWAVASLAAGQATYFWPVWVIGPWGLVMAARRLTDDRPMTHG